MSFWVLLHSQPSFHSAKNDKLHERRNLKSTRKGQQWQILHEMNDGSVLMLDNSEFELYKNITTGEIIILYQVKNLDAVVIPINHNYSSITEISCRNWILKLSSLKTFTSKFYNKLST